MTTKTVNQISIFLENKPGSLNEMLSCIGRQGTNIIALSIADTTDFGIVRLVVPTGSLEPTIEALRADGFIAKKSAVVGVMVPQQPGSLAAVLQALAGVDLQVEYAYSLSRSMDENAVILLQTSDNDACVEALLAAGVQLVDNDQLA